MSNELPADFGKSLQQVVRAETGAPESLVPAVVRIVTSEIFLDGFSAESDAALAKGAKAAWRRVFRLGGDAYDRLTLETLRGNVEGEAEALLTLGKVDLMLRSCEALQYQTFKAA